TAGELVLEVDNLSGRPAAEPSALGLQEPAVTSQPSTAPMASVPEGADSSPVREPPAIQSPGIRFLRASLKLHRGEVVGIAGLVGAGRTEFLRSLFGLDKVRSGKIRLAAYTGTAAPARRWSQGMGMV